MKRSILILFVLCLILSLTACDGAGNKETVRIGFKNASSYEELSKFNGKQVSMNGYLATSSPADGSFIFLMNLPYQSCPFCVPNTTQLSNTIEVYPLKGKSFDYTTQAVTVTGTLEVAGEGESFSDPYGYTFNFRIIDADYVFVRDSDMTDEIRLWQSLAGTGAVNDLNSMFDFLNFVCCWPSYYVNSYTDLDGNTVPGYYLYAGDAENALFEDGVQFNYGLADGYFEGIIREIEAVDSSAFDDITGIVREAQALSERAISALRNGEYTCETQFVEQFGTEDMIYTLTDPTLSEENDVLYGRYADWIAKWEL